MTNKQYGFLFDASKCSGCKACHIACQDKFNVIDTIKPRRVYEYAGGNFDLDGKVVHSNDVFSYYTSIGCNHCSHPVCVKACPTGACHKERATGIVKIESSLCVGCKSCARACPYDAPQFDQQRGYMIKCDGCIDRVAEGKQPICVESCTMRALQFGEISELKQKYPMAKIANVAPLPSSDITQPNLLIIENKNSKSSGSSEGQLVNEFEV
ncbi:dimethylsulfoxide reductase subunit B [Shewanella sp. Isolate13]|uniref:DMSO/selenate family reductase complex B subunit n=1 Tax=Shewanella sp. Isolate13 TaxID=2908531 RepID=UPI001EFEC0AF|nr:DMSO/selenate family reductase complex B subunit [Shewanella sp. Isolate13]MCG9729525.1 dimethylsulfoxide reductase subunit B [Shewanella sp. Isolate13]